MLQEENPRFPEQDGSEKLHGDLQAKKEKFLREGGKIEDFPEEDVAKMSSGAEKKNNNDSTHLTDSSGEEKKEDYINTDERKRDLNQQRGGL